MTEKDNGIEEIIIRRDRLRAGWREIREKRLDLRNRLIEKGLTRAELRKERFYKKLKKEQEYFSKRIRHLEKEINRRRS